MSSHSGVVTHPVAPLYRFKTDAEAIKMANDPTLTLPSSWESGQLKQKPSRSAGAVHLLTPRTK